MTRALHGKVALVTGSSTGIGRAVATELAAQACDVAIHFRKHRSRAEETAAEVGLHDVRALIVKADVTVESEVEALFQRVHGAFGRLDYLVNAAGTLIRREPFLETSIEVWDQVFAVNARGAFLCCRAALRDMVKREKGKIVNISADWRSTKPSEMAVAFLASKASVDAMTVMLAREYAPYGIMVNALAPGLIDTPFHKRYTSPELYEELVKSTPLERAGTAAEVAALARHLLSPAGDYITGQIISLTGGR